MTQAAFSVHVPATTANIGPGFDSIGLALDLWNEASFFFDGKGLSFSVQGYRPAFEIQPENNLIYKAFAELCRVCGKATPQALRIVCNNRIPVGSGLGSSAAAILIGLLAADAWLGSQLSKKELLEIASAIEGHPDNAAAAIYGGLIGICSDGTSFHEDSFPVAEWNTVVVLPKFDLSTKASRKILPEKVCLKDAVFNISHALFVMQALGSGDENLLGIAMQDRLHQPYRIPLIPGADLIINAAKASGAAAVGLSGAGPSLISFMMSDPETILSKMRAILEPAGLDIEFFTPRISRCGAYVAASAANEQASEF